MPDVEGTAPTALVARAEPNFLLWDVPEMGVPSRRVLTTARRMLSSRRMSNRCSSVRQMTDTRTTSIHEIRSLPVIAPQNAEGTISACKNCSGLQCCGTLRPGGSIEPPFLTPDDVHRISRVTGLPDDDFSEPRLNPATGKYVVFMRTQPGTGCVFFDHESGRCTIYKHRPIDCRLFPLDIEFDDGVFYWALHNHDSCRLKSNDVRSLIRYGECAIQQLTGVILDYATVPVPGMNAVGYTRLRPVRSCKDNGCKHS